VSSDVPTADAADAALVARMSNGDRAALAELYERHAARMLALALSILRDREEAEDLLHDVFLEAWRRSADYSVERGSVRAWLATRTRSRALDRIKSTRRRRDVPDEGDPVVVTLPFAMDDHQLLRQTLKHMPEPQKQVIVARLFRGSQRRRNRRTARHSGGNGQEQDARGAGKLARVARGGGA
jgi:RNA polymerase sigma-70 factor (ECF subfamily)